MVEIKAITYEQARTDFLKAEMEKAQNRMKFWQTKIKKAKNAITEMEAHDNASNAGWEYNFYKDALEALEDNRFQYETGFVRGFESAQPKWISVEERLPKTREFVLIKYAKNAQNPTLHARNTMAVGRYEYGMFLVEGCSVKVTHWMPLPASPEEAK